MPVPHRVAGVGEQLRALVSAGALDLPLPGSGRTEERWRALTAVAAEDLCVARLAEAHLDALAILAELDGPSPPAGSMWGVWAAHPPQPPLTAAPGPTGWVLNGRKPWCSGARTYSHALVSADARDGYRLFAVDLAYARPVDGTWPAVGMAGSDSLDVDLTGAPAIPVGDQGDYLDRPGFWHGALAVAACWYGGAVGVARALLTADRGPHALAHLGAADVALTAAGAALQAAAVLVDADPRADLEQVAVRVRAQVEAAATEVLDHTGRALGAAPLCRDGRHAALAADLPVYLRQSHAEADLEHLGRLALQRGVAWR